MIPLGVLASAYMTAAGGGATLTHRTSQDVGSGSATNTLTAVAIGSAGAAREVVVLVVWGGSSSLNRTVNTVTVGGISAAADINTGTDDGGVAIWRANVPTGTTADVVVTMSGTGQPGVISVYTSPDGLSLDQALSGAVAAAATSATLSLTSGGATSAIVAGAVTKDSGTTPSFTAGIDTADNSSVSAPATRIAGHGVGSANPHDVTVTLDFAAVVAVQYVAAASYSAVPSTPPVAGYSAWWDFSDSSSLTLSGSEITDVSDKSGNGRHLAKSATGGPTKTTSATLGSSIRSIARFDGTTGKLLSIVDDLGITGDFTWFAAAQKQTGSQTGADSDVMFGTRGLAAYVSTATMTIWLGASAQNVTGSSAIWQPASVHSRQLSGSNHSYWIDATNYVSAVAGGSGSAGTTYVGGEPTAGSDWDIGEIVVYPSALSGTDRASVVSYLTTKWSI